MIVCDRQEVLGRWLCERTGGAYLAGESTYIGLETDGKIVAVAGYDDYNGASVRAHLAIDGKLTPEFIWYGFYYPFEELKVNKIIGLVASTNHKALRLDKHFGYIEEAIIKDAVPYGDLHILTMTKDQCRYLTRKHHGQQILSACRA